MNFNSNQGLLIPPLTSLPTSQSNNFLTWLHIRMTHDIGGKKEYT